MKTNLKIILSLVVGVTPLILFYIKDTYFVSGSGCVLPAGAITVNCERIVTASLENPWFVAIILGVVLAVFTYFVLGFLRNHKK